ncbi:polar amino acid ABC transporter permease [Sinorhizobium glycinis]|uniref:Polar amino acid ABC transporter permease n=1 Tax=Sinorhizobium glycinis TaxID=1472378 RepID=A0A178XQX2_9HYPH|nr:amino acid ABC transporter permease [Sinorhizobium glycinis]OAP37659.1 polar amino acid ABC transporter permease [Sinorhizobium glycinis]
MSDTFKLPLRDRQSDLPVLLPLKVPEPDVLGFSRWLASMPGWTLPALTAVLALWPVYAMAQSTFTTERVLSTLLKWTPLLVTKGFVLNILISFLTVVFGTIAGIFLGLGRVSHSRVVRLFSWFTVQLFRNSPWLVLLFVVMLTLPFELRIGGAIIPVPDWMKAVFGLSLPVMANIAEIVRGAIRSVPSGQWEAAESLAFSRTQTLWQIILPQCFKRMIPPWMNWYAIMTMATPLVSLLGVTEIITLTRQAMEAEGNHPSLLVPFYGFALIIFFAYCYPIARLTMSLEKRFAVKL